MGKFLGIMLLLFTFVLFTLMYTLRREAAVVMPSAPVYRIETGIG